MRVYKTTQSSVNDTQKTKAHKLSAHSCIEIQVIGGKWTDLIDHSVFVSCAQKALSPVMARQPPLRSLPDGFFFFYLAAEFFWT